MKPETWAILASVHFYFVVSSFNCEGKNNFQNLVYACEFVCPCECVTLEMIELVINYDKFVDAN